MFVICIIKEFQSTFAYKGDGNSVEFYENKNINCGFYNSLYPKVIIKIIASSNVNIKNGEKFDNLEIGNEVRFHEEMGDEGPQASSVKLVGKHHIV